MRFAKRLETFLKDNQIDRMNTLTNAFWSAKSQWYYRHNFGAFGRGSVIRKPMLIRRPQHIYIGSDVHIRDGVRLEVVSDGTSRIPKLQIGDDVNIEQNVHIICHNRVTIHRNVSITGNCAIVDTTHSFRDYKGDPKIGARVEADAAEVEICEGAFVGYGSIILPNVRIGRCAVIGAGSIVTKDVPDYAVAIGSPAKVVEVYRTPDDLAK